MALLAAGPLLIGAGGAAAQTGGAASSVGVNSNANSNSQFLSGSNTGVNNGSLEIYSGADPYQGIVLEGSTDLPQLPGFVPPASNFSQPYRPETFVNTPAFLPAEMTLAEAKRCRDSKGSWYGGSRTDEAPSIRLFYAAKQERPTVPLTMGNYVGTAMAKTADGPFIAALCEAAYRAMRKGASVGVVDFGIRPKNTMFGIGYGASGGATGLPAAGAHPYAIAGTLGFGTGWSSQRVEGEVLLQLTALRSPDGPPAPAAESIPPPGSSIGEEIASSPEPETSPTPETEPARARDGRSGPVSGAPDGAGPAEDHGPGGSSPALTYHPVERLAGVRSGQSKQRLFDLFGTVFVEQHGEGVEVEGMRIRAAGRSESNTRLEVSEVTLAETRWRATRYWFLFEDGRLIAWGRPEQWQATAVRHRVDGLDPSGSVPLSLAAKAGRGSGE